MKYIESVQTVIKNNTSAQTYYVCQDTGNDANDGSLARPFKTIQAGINAANLIAAYYKQVIVKVFPSTSGNGYVENITFSQQGVILESATFRRPDRSIIIKGNIVVNLTGVSGGANFVAALNEVFIRGFVLTCSSGNTITFSGTLFQRLWLSDCYIDNTGTGSAVVLTNTGTTGGIPSTVEGIDVHYNNSNVTNPVIRISAGRFWSWSSTGYVSNANASGPSVIMDGASATGASCILTGYQLTGQVSITDNTASFTANLSSIASGSAAAVVTPSTPSTGLITLAYVGLNTTATNSITGSGVVALINVDKLSTGGDVVSTVTQVVLPTFPQGATLIGATATQTTNTLLTIKNGHIKTQQTTAPTTTTNANAGTGASSSVSNATDTAGKLSLTTGSLATPAAGVQTTVNFNKTYNVAPIVTLTPTNANAAGGVSTLQTFVTSTTSGFSINFGIAGAATTTYTWNYMVIETQ